MAILQYGGKSLKTPGGTLFLTFGNESVNQVFEIEITTVSSNQPIQLPHLQYDPDSNLYNYNYIVDYGDGNIKTVTSWNDINTNNTYVNPGTYTIKISGICETFACDSGTTIQSLIKRILNWGRTGLRYVDFEGSYDLTSIASDTQGLAGIVSFLNTFQYCSSLTTIPSDLFKYATGATIFWNTFSSAGLTSIPNGLFNHNLLATGFTNTFAGCPITSIPSGLFDHNTNALSMYGTFASCPITSIPTDLFKYNTLVTDFGFLFNSTNISTIPSTLFTHNVNAASFQQTFQNCSNITTIPVGLFDNLTQAGNFSRVFLYCTALTSIPSTIFTGCTEATIAGDFSYSFYGCSSLAGSTAPTLWIPYPYSYHLDCFTGDAFSNQSAAISNGWASY